MTSPLASLRARVDAEKARRSDSGIPFCPQKPHPAQRRFLDLQTPEALFGGAAGPGKSSALIMAALQHVDRPGYSALLLRRTYPELAQPNAIMDRCAAWLRPSGARWNGELKQWTFPSSARLTFGYCENYADTSRYQGPEYHFVGFDELTHLAEERTWTYFDTRIRRNKGDDTPLRMRAATNPGGLGHAWVKARYVTAHNPQRPFVPALAKDNPSLNVEEYETKLANQPELIRKQLLEGLWVNDTTGFVYKFTRARNVAHELPDFTGWQTVIAVDLGASEIVPTTAFSIVRWHPQHPTSYCVRSWKEAGMSPTTCGERILEAMEIFPGCQVTMDEGALGVGYGREMRTRFQIPVIAATKTDKLGAIRLMNGALEGHPLPDKTIGPPELMIDATECPGLVDELEGLIWHPSGLRHDPSTPNHESDALLYGWRMAQSWASRYHKPEPKLSEEERLEKIARSRYDARRSNPDADW